jgi:hypothetical protein
VRASGRDREGKCFFQGEAAEQAGAESGVSSRPRRRRDSIEAVKPQESLPLTYLLTIVKEPAKGSRVLAVVGVVMQGDEVISRRVFYAFEDKQDALDEMNRRGTRAWYFEDTSEFEAL